MEVSAAVQTDQALSVSGLDYVAEEYWPKPAAVQFPPAQPDAEDGRGNCFVELSNMQVDGLCGVSGGQEAVFTSDHTPTPSARVSTMSSGMKRVDSDCGYRSSTDSYIVISDDDDEVDTANAQSGVTEHREVWNNGEMVILDDEEDLTIKTVHSGMPAQEVLSSRSQQANADSQGESVWEIAEGKCASQPAGGKFPSSPSVAVGHALSAPFPLLLQSADGSFLQAFNQHIFSPFAAAFPVNMATGSAPTRTVSLLSGNVVSQCNALCPTVMPRPACHSSPVVYVQQSVPWLLQAQPSPVLVPAWSQGQFPGSQELSGVMDTQSKSPSSSGARLEPKARKRKDPIGCVAGGQSSGRVHHRSGGQGSPALKKTVPGSRVKKMDSDVAISNCRPVSKNSKLSRKALANVNTSFVKNIADGSPLIPGPCEQHKLPKPTLNRSKVTPKTEELQGVSVKQKKHKPSSNFTGQGAQRSKKNKRSHRPQHYFPSWPAVEQEDESEDARVMAAFFKSIRSRRADKRRFTSKELERERERETEEKLLSGCQDGLKVVNLEGKGRGVVADKVFEKDEFVVEYAGELINVTTANQREGLYERDEKLGCYMYYFSHKGKHYCIDATAETGKLGRLLNHSRRGNCYTKVVAVGDAPRLVLLAAQRVEEGEELTYDYGDRSPSAIENHPWLKN